MNALARATSLKRQGDSNRDTKQPKKFVRASPKLSEWLVDRHNFTADDRVDFLKRLLASVTKERARVYLPGIGMSRLGFHLAKYFDVYVSDIDDASIVFQREIAATLETEHGALSVLEASDDLLQPPEYEERFDVIIDVSVTDVFLRGGNAPALVNGLVSRLTETGVLISFSMFDRKWISLLQGFQFAHCSIYMTTNTSVRNAGGVRKDTTVFLISRHALPYAELPVPVARHDTRERKWIANRFDFDGVTLDSVGS